MATKIEWTDETWNPVVGCSAVSPGCDNCYAATVAHRGMQPAHRDLTINTDHGIEWNGTIRMLPDRLELPRWPAGRRIFVCSMSDLFHPTVPELFIRAVFSTMADHPEHTFQVLTKRPQRMAATLSSPAFWFDIWRNRPGAIPDHLPNVWLGTSIESDYYTFRADHLRDTPAAIRFLSLEPLLGALPRLDLDDIGWVIAGGESGPRARPMHRSWVRAIRDACALADVPFLFKQHGSWASYTDGEMHCDRLSEGFRQIVMDKHGTILDPDEPCSIDREPTLFLKFGKTRAGRTLDGRTHDQFPVSKSERTAP